MRKPNKRLEGKELLDWIRSKCEVEGHCWFWQSTLDSYGVPTMRLPGNRKAGWKSVRRVSLELSGEELQPKMQVISTCGNRDCCNPIHLKQVTVKERNQIISANGGWQTKDRAAKIAAKQRTRAKLTMEGAREIRLSSEPGEVLAQRYGIAKSTIYAIKRGERWKDFSSPWSALLTAANANWRKQA